MAGYDFKDRRIAQRLKRQAQLLSPLNQGRSPSYTDAYLFKAPSGGIPAKSGTTCGKADCDLYHFAYDGTDATITQTQDSSGTNITCTVFNWTGTAITGNAFFWAILAYELLTVMNEDCS